MSSSTNRHVRLKPSPRLNSTTHRDRSKRNGHLAPMMHEDRQVVRRRRGCKRHGLDDAHGEAVHADAQRQPPKRSHRAVVVVAVRLGSLAGPTRMRGAGRETSPPATGPARCLQEAGGGNRRGSFPPTRRPSFGRSEAWRSGCQAVRRIRRRRRRTIPRDADAAQRRPEGRGGGAGKTAAGTQAKPPSRPWRSRHPRRRAFSRRAENDVLKERSSTITRQRESATYMIAITDTPPVSVSRCVEQYIHIWTNIKSQMTGAYGLEKPHAPPLRAKRVHCSTPRGPAAGSTALRSKAYGSAHHYLPRSLAHGGVPPLPHGQALEACAPSIRKNFAHEPVWGQEVEGDPLELHPFGAFRWPFVAT